MGGGLGFGKLNVGAAASDNAAISTADASTPASLIQWSLAATVAYLFPEPRPFDLQFFAGLEPNFTFIGQQSVLDPSIGSFRGKRVSWLAPVVGAVWSHSLIIKLRADITGNYVLSQPTAEGSTLSYTSPLGAQLSLLYPLREVLPVGGLHAGLQAQYLTYSTREISGVSSEPLTTRLSWLQVAFTVAYVF